MTVTAHRDTESPRTAWTLFVPKPDKGLWTVHGFNAINDVAVESNYPMRRIEPRTLTVIRKTGYDVFRDLKVD